MVPCPVDDAEAVPTASSPVCGHIDMRHSASYSLSGGSESWSPVRARSRCSPLRAAASSPGPGSPGPGSPSSLALTSPSHGSPSRYASDRSQARPFPMLGAAVAAASGRHSPDVAAVPSWWACASPEWAALIVPLVVLSVVGGCWFSVDGVTATTWYAGLYAATALATLLFVMLHFALSTQRLLVHLRPALAAALASEEAQPGLDPRLQFLQLTLRAKATAAAAAAAAPADPLDFLLAELEAWAARQEGYVVTSATGIILWANAALARYFGYALDELLHQNIRVLMPNPYASQHDYFMRKHVDTGVCCVLGKSREVPALDKSGMQSVVMLTLDHRLDPRDAANRLFVGRLDFHPEDPQVREARGELAATAGRPVDALQGLEAVPEAVVASDAQGTILFANARACALFQWEPSELLGENVRVLMAEPFASAHDRFLQAYARQAENAQHQGLSQPPSRLVGSGRDVMAMAKSGQRVRVFLMVTRMDRPSGCPQHCVFVAKMVAVSQADGGPPASPSPSPSRNRSPSPRLSPGRPMGSGVAWRRGFPLTLRAASPARTSSSRRSSSGGSSASPSASLDPAVVVTLGRFERRRCTVVALAVEARHGGDPQPDDLGVVVGMAAAQCTQHRGLPRWVVGAQLGVVFNAPGLPNACHRFSAATFMLQLTQDFAHHPVAQRCVLRAAAVASDTLWGQWGTQPLLAGPTLHHADILLHAHSEGQVCNPMLDGALYKELQYSHACRLVNRAVVLEPGVAPMVLEAYELLAPRESHGSLWMYELPTSDPAPTPWALAWRLLPLDPPASRRPPPDEAARLVQESLDADPADATAQWLLGVLQQRCRPPPALRRCGPLQYQLQFESTKTVRVAPQDREASFRHAPR